MSGKPAARAGDLHVCPMVDPGPVPHIGGTIKPTRATSVKIGGMSAARMGDALQCSSPTPNAIIAGAFPVPIANMPAARVGDSTAHGGSVTMGFPTVVIGLAGTTGNPRVGNIMCSAASSGRTSNSTKQSYGNCGIESSRQIINQATGANLTENYLFLSAINLGFAGGPVRQSLAKAGGTSAVGRQRILARNGIASTVQKTNSTNLGLAMSQGKGAIVNLDASKLWPPGTARAGSWHAVTVTGMVYDDAGNITHVIINDTGSGQCGRHVPLQQFNEAVAAHTRSELNITSKPLW